MKTETLKSLRRRAAIGASLIAVGIAIFIVAYLTAVERGALPSATQPLVPKSEAVASNQLPVNVKAVAVAVIPAPSALPTAALPSTPMAALAVQVKPHDVQLTKQDAPKMDAPTPTNVVVAARSSDRMQKMASPTADDQRVARKWLEETTNRPAIRVRYNPNEILQLVESQRGLLVVGSGETNNPREFYLASKAGTAPLFDRLTKAILDHYSTYSLALNPSPLFSPLAASLPAYFPDTNYEFSFVPHRELAMEIFSKVASASRSMPKELSGQGPVIFEGQLRLDGAQLTFELLEVRSGMNRYSFTKENETSLR